MTTRSVTEIPCFFEKVVKEDRNLIGCRLVSETALPVMQKLAAVSKPAGPSLKTGAVNDWAWNASLGVSRGEAGATTVLDGATRLPTTVSPFVEIVAGAGVGTGLAGVHDAHKQYKRSSHIHDTTGQRLAALSGLEMGAFAMGSAADAASKIFNIIRDIGNVIHNPVVFGVAATTALVVLTTASLVLYSLFYLVCTARFACLGVSWYRGRHLREELSKTADPVNALYKQLQDHIQRVSADPKKLYDLGLQAGAKWLEKVAQESHGELEITGNKEDVFQQLIQKHPEIVRELIGDTGRNLDGYAELTRLGRYVAYQQECTRFEAECLRKLGSTAVEAMKTGDNEKLKEAIASKPWKGLALKVGVATLGLLAVLGATIMVVGSPMGVLLIVAGLLSVGLALFSDGLSLRSVLQKGEFTKHDWKYIYSSLALSVASFAGVVVLTIATGGIGTMALSLALSGLWLCINTYSAHALWRYDNRRWEVQQVVDRVTYRKFLETKPTEKEVAIVQAKMTEKDQRYVRRLKDPLPQLKKQETQLLTLRQQGLSDLIAMIPRG